MTTSFSTAARAALVLLANPEEALRTPFNPYIFHVRAGYLDETEHMVHQVVTLGMKRIAVMYQNDAFGKAGLAGVEAAIARRWSGPTRAKLVKALEGMGSYDLGGTRVQYSPTNRIGSRFVEVTVIGGSRKLLH